MDNEVLRVRVCRLIVREQLYRCSVLVSQANKLEDDPFDMVA